jgi:hypothetical protein
MIAVSGGVVAYKEKWRLYRLCSQVAHDEVEELAAFLRNKVNS